MSDVSPSAPASAAEAALAESTGTVSVVTTVTASTPAEPAPAAAPAPPTSSAPAEPPLGVAVVSDRPSGRFKTLARTTPMTKSGAIPRPPSSSGSIPRPSSGSTRRLSPSGRWPSELERPSTSTAPADVPARTEPFRLRQARRLRRWFLPGTLLSVACAAVVSLALGEVALELDPPRPPATAPLTGPLVAGAPLAVEPLSPPKAAPTRGGPRATPPGHAPRSHGPSSDAPIGVAQVVASPAHTPGPRTLLATGALADLARLRTLGARLAKVEQLGAGEPEQAAGTLAALLDGELPGADAYEVEQLRLKCLGKLGTLRGPTADRALLGRLDPERPRPERLLALSAMATRPETLALARVDLERIVASDADLVVRRVAARTLKAATR